MAFSPKKLGLKLGKLAAERPNEVKEVMKEVAKLINNSGKTSKLPEIIRCFNSSYNKESNTLDVTLTATNKSHIPQLKEIQGRKVNITEVIDPKVIGGVKIETDNFIVDGTILNKIKKLKTLATNS